MKIYNKSGFGWGIFLTAIGLAMLATSIWTGFDVKGTILMYLILFVTELAALAWFEKKL